MRANHKLQITNHQFQLVASILLLSFLLTAEEMPPAARLTLDLDGQGSEETASAVSDGKEVRLEIRDASGKLLARVAAPAPAAKGRTLTLSAGTLGSAG